MIKKKFYEDDDSHQSVDDRKSTLIKKLRGMKPTDVISLLASDDSDIIENLERGTEAYDLWVETLEDLNVSDVISTRQTLSNIRKLKDYVKHDEDISDLEDDSDSSNQSPKETILDNKQVQDLLCEATRSFVRNVKQEFGNILLAFSARLIGLMEDLGYKDPARGAFYLVDDNSSIICSAIINAVSDYTESSPSVVGVNVKRSTTDKRSLGLKHGVSTVLLSELIKIFDEEVVTNPEDAITLDSNDREVVNVASAINLSDLIHVNKTRKLVSDGCYTIYTAFRMQRGGYSSNFNFGMQIIPITDSSFNVLYYLYLSDSVSKPNGQLQCSEWV